MIQRIANPTLLRSPRSASRPGTVFHPRGVVLLLVLVVVALLGLAAYTFSELMLTEYRGAIVSQRQAQTRVLADSGVEFVREFLRETDEVQLQNGGRYNNPGYFQSNLVIQGPLPRDRGRFSVVAANIENGELAGVRFGVEDESTRLNLNTILLADKAQEGAAQALLMALPGMTPEAADSILDWLDPDNEPRENGAEIDYYSALGYSCKNGPLDTIEELLLVKGVTPELLFGRDANRNGVVDANEMSNPSLAENTASPSEVDRGWASLLTLYSVEANVRPDGTPRIDLNGSDMQKLHDDLSAVFSPEWSDFIVAYRQYGPYTQNSQNNQSSTGNSQNNQSQNNQSQNEQSSTPSTGGPVQLDYTQPAKAQLTSVLDLIGAKVRVTPPAQNTQQNTQQNNQPSRGSSSISPSRRSFVGLEILSNFSPVAFLAAQAGGGRGGSGLGGTNTLGGQGAGGQGAGGQGGGQGGNQSSGGQNNQGGQNNNDQSTILESPFPNDPLALSTILPDFLDHVTVNKSPTIPGRININQASRVILRGIPGMTDEIVEAIVAAREVQPTGNKPAHRHEHWLLCESIVTLDEMKKLAPFVTAGGRVFRAQIVGYFEEEGPASRVEVVVNAANTAAGSTSPRVVFWRDLTNLGRGYNLATLGGGAQ